MNIDIKPAEPGWYVAFKVREGEYKCHRIVNWVCDLDGIVTNRSDSSGFIYIEPRAKGPVCGSAETDGFYDIFYDPSFKATHLYLTGNKLKDLLVG